MHISRLAIERDRVVRLQGNFQESFQKGYIQREPAKPILGAQPPQPRIVPLRYVDIQYQEPSHKLVSTLLYYQDLE